MSRNDGQSLLKFKYNADGIRTNKIVDGANHVYTLNGTRIVSEAWGNHQVIYLYDESGSPIGLQYRTKSYAANVFDTFYLEKNLQGDIVAVYNADGDKIGSYTYDAWGNCTVTVVSGTTTLEKNVVRSYNPFRYRGYYYDTETGLYYLQSRYYNPAWGRFLNADGYVNANGDLIGFNMYAYCSNNPVMGYDPSGYADEDIKDDDIGHIKDPAPVYNGTGNTGLGAGSGMDAGAGKGLRLNIKSAQKWLQSFVDKANATIQKTGHVGGTLKHSFLSQCIKVFGNEYLHTEVSYKNGEVVDFGTPGSIRVDAVLGDINNPIAAWDLKTGSATLSPSRIAKMQVAIGQTIPIFQIR